MAGLSSWRVEAVEEAIEWLKEGLIAPEEAVSPWLQLSLHHADDHWAQAALSNYKDQLVALGVQVPTT